MHSQKKDVDKFLRDVRIAISKKNITPTNRRKNLDTLAELGIKWSDAIDVISGLTFNDYIKGPEEDRDYPSSDMFWMFKKKAFGEVIYIKIKIKYLDDNGLAIVSFHIDE